MLLSTNDFELSGNPTLNQFNERGSKQNINPNKTSQHFKTTDNFSSLKYYRF